jgi:hypothetical protein
MTLIKVQRVNNNSSNNYWIQYYKEELETFRNGINYTTSPLTKTETLYIEGKGISQDKLRNAGFKITRLKDKADLIVIGDVVPITWRYNNSDKTTYYTSAVADVVDASMDQYIAEELLGYKYINKKEIYPYLYKYIGDKTLFENISELLVSNNNDNAKIAMEYMSNANWEGNEIYLQEIFNMYYSGYMHDNLYRTSVSFKGFLDTLDFSYKHLHLRDSDDYRKLCLNEEHHKWVHAKYDAIFKKELKHLLTKYKLKLNALEVSIDYTKEKKDDEDDE